MAFQRFLTRRGTHAITLYGDGEQTRDFNLCVDIVAAKHGAAAQGRPGSVYNLCGWCSRVTMNHVLELIRKVTGKAVAVQSRTRAERDMRHTYAYVGRPPRSRLQPQVTLESGLDQQYRGLTR